MITFTAAILLFLAAPLAGCGNWIFLFCSGDCVWRELPFFMLYTRKENQPVCLPC